MVLVPCYLVESRGRAIRITYSFSSQCETPTMCVESLFKLSLIDVEVADVEVGPMLALAVERSET